MSIYAGLATWAVGQARSRPPGRGVSLVEIDSDKTGQPVLIGEL
jgi:hypothetical protein